jgi:hypothetical protein
MTPAFNVLAIRVTSLSSAIPHEFQDQIMRNLVEKTLRINGCVPPVSLLHPLPNVFDRLVPASPPSKTLFGCSKVMVKYLLKHQIHSLADDSVSYCRYPKFPHLSGSFLRYQSPSGRSKTVCFALDLLVDRLQQCPLLPQTHLPLSHLFPLLQHFFLSPAMPIAVVSVHRPFLIHSLVSLPLPPDCLQL